MAVPREQSWNRICVPRTTPDGETLSWMQCQLSMLLSRERSAIGEYLEAGILKFDSRIVGMRTFGVPRAWA